MSQNVIAIRKKIENYLLCIVLGRLLITHEKNERKVFVFFLFVIFIIIIIRLTTFSNIFNWNVF